MICFMVVFFGDFHNNFLKACRKGVNLSLAVFQHGGVAKWPKAEVCKTFIHRFESDRRLHN